MLSETHLTNEIDDSEMNIEHYTLFRTDSTSRHTGGVAIYVRDEVTVLSQEAIIILMNMCLISLKIKWNNFCFVVACVYHSSNSCHQMFINDLNEWFQKK